MACLLPLSAFAKDIGTITLKDGTVYEAVTYTVNNYHKTIEFTVDEDKKAVSFSDVDRIISNKGVDVTGDVIGGYYRPEQGETWESESSVVYTTAHKKLWAASLQLGGHYCFPLGDYYEGFSSNIGFDANLVIALSNKLGLRATVSKAGMKADDDLGFVVFYDFQPVGTLTNYDISTWRYFISVQYSNRLGKVTPGKTELYLFTGLGAVSHRVSADETIFGETPDLDVTSRVSNTETKFATTFGVGMVQLFSPKVGFYVGADFDVLYIDTEDDYDVWGGGINYAYQFDLKLGLTFFLPNETSDSGR